ncbi:hypothetical protein GOM49_15015 [Clostridium bovifaecis]|uniref:Uncharacterized protein n=1 Tax=Clostridium bovifaecis TaxID=2184719 RepID=A0A6I6ER63_9CLOT|nr:hypothetical protein GOM49_15015 [Clostridium bovifaecis]
MRDKEHLKKNYKSFAQFLSTVCARELEYFILDSKFTSAFNYRIKKMVDEVKKEGKEDIEFSVLFNTDGEIVLIDAEIIGNFISNNYVVYIQKFYKDAPLNKIIKEVINGSEKGRRDFITVSCSILYKTLEELYKDIKYKKETVVKYGISYGLQTYEGENLSIIVAILLMMEDVCEYLSINKSMLKDSINMIISSKRIR